MSDAENPTPAPTTGSIPSVPFPPTQRSSGLQLPEDLKLKEHKARTARVIALSFIVILGLTFGVYILMLVFLIHSGHTKEIEYLEHFYTGWLPAIVGLTSASAAFYFARYKD